MALPGHVVGLKTDASRTEQMAARRMKDISHEARGAGRRLKRGKWQLTSVWRHVDKDSRIRSTMRSEKKDATLSFSSLGMKTQAKKLTGRRTGCARPLELIARRRLRCQLAEGAPTAT